MPTIQETPNVDKIIEVAKDKNEESKSSVATLPSLEEVDTQESTLKSLKDKQVKPLPNEIHNSYVEKYEKVTKELEDIIIEDHGTGKYPVGGDYQINITTNSGETKEVFLKTGLETVTDIAFIDNEEWIPVSEPVSYVKKDAEELKAITELEELLENAKTIEVIKGDDVR